MCLIVNEGERKIAEFDIRTYKVVDCDKLPPTHWCGVHRYNRKTFEFNKVLKETAPSEDKMFKHDERLYVRDGFFYSFSNPALAQTEYEDNLSRAKLGLATDLEICECVVPKGSVYYSEKYGENGFAIASSKIVVKNPNGIIGKMMLCVGKENKSIANQDITAYSVGNKSISNNMLMLPYCPIGGNPYIKNFEFGFKYEANITGEIENVHDAGNGRVLLANDWFHVRKTIESCKNHIENNMLEKDWNVFECTIPKGATIYSNDILGWYATNIIMFNRIVDI